MKTIGAIGIGVGVALGVTTGLTVRAMHKLRAQVLESLDQEPSYMVSGPLTSVIIPALEEQDYLPKLLMSIQNQTYEPIEVIVADSSPHDSHELTDQICRQYGAICLHIPMLGPANARNQGASQAQGDILLFTDADNILASNCIENLIYSLQEGYIIAHPVECIIDDTGLAAFGAVWITNWLKGTNATTRAVAIWKDAFDQVKYDESCDPLQGCREDLRFGQDIIKRFGPGSIKLDRDALIGTSARRFKKQGLLPRGVPWEYRGVRDGVIRALPRLTRVRESTKEEGMACFETGRSSVKELTPNGAISIVVGDGRIKRYDDLLANVRHDDKYHSIRSLVMPDDPEVREVARVLMQAPDFISAAQELVNSFTTYGSEVGDLWRTPAETLAKRTGVDCDDSAILLTSILRAGGILPDQVYCAFGLWTLDGETDGHMWTVLGSDSGEDRTLESTAPPGKHTRGKYIIHGIFNDQYTFATNIGLKEFDLKTVEMAEASVLKR